MSSSSLFLAARRPLRLGPVGTEEEEIEGGAGGAGMTTAIPGTGTGAGAGPADIVVVVVAVVVAGRTGAFLVFVFVFISRFLGAGEGGGAGGPAFLALSACLFAGAGRVWAPPSSSSTSWSTASIFLFRRVDLRSSCCLGTMGEEGGAEDKGDDEMEARMAEMEAAAAGAVAAEAEAGGVEGDS